MFKQNVSDTVMAWGSFLGLLGLAWQSDEATPRAIFLATALLEVFLQGTLTTMLVDMYTIGKALTEKE